MIKIPNGKQFWVGKFTYSNSKEEAEGKTKEVPYVMELDFRDGEFHGTTIDQESKDLFSEPITVNGFLEKDFISFIVMYPHNYYFDDQENKFIVEYGRDYPGCEYEGNFNTSENCFEGTWKIIIGEFKEGLFQEESGFDFVHGKWKMYEKQ